MSNCCTGENINEFVRRRRKLICHIFLGLIVLVLAVSVIKYLSYKLNRPSSIDSFPFDFLMLSVSWPISFCKSLKNGKSCTHKCNLSEDSWTIHGFWPNKIGNYKITNCSSSPFNETELDPIRNQMEEYWPTKNNCWNNSGFWEHEWSKHGICALELKLLNTQLKYFQQTLDLYKEYNVTEALKNCKIYPNDSTSYQKKDIVDCFENHFKVSPRLICSCSKLLNKTFLMEVQLCFDRGLVPQNCESSFLIRNSNCNETLIMYPAHV